LPKETFSTTCCLTHPSTNTGTPGANLCMKSALRWWRIAERRRRRPCG
jgi:hypothetical protein